MNDKHRLQIDLSQEAALFGEIEALYYLFFVSQIGEHSHGLHLINAAKVFASILMRWEKWIVYRNGHKYRIFKFSVYKNGDAIIIHLIK
jgi:hypothetical protein